MKKNEDEKQAIPPFIQYELGIEIVKTFFHTEFQDIYYLTVI